jgi:hypothetical protein
MGRGFLLSGLAVVTLGVATSGAAVSSQAARHHGKFSCKAWGAQIGGMNFAVANRVNSPCQDKLARVDKAGRTLKNVRLGVLTSRTRIKDWRHVRPGTRGTASARSAKVVLGLSSKEAIKIGVATSSATDRCVAKGGKMVLKQVHQSNIAYIVVNGKKERPGTKSEKIPLGPLGTIYLNRVLRKGHTLTVRAVQIDLGGKKPTVILAQSQVGYTGQPCATK